MTDARRALAILAAAAALCGGYALLLAWHHPQPHLAESNLTANRLRLERFFFDGPRRVALVGSSITGRLLPEYFQGTALESVSNLGLDGATPRLGLELCNARLPRPAVVLVEAERLGLSADANEAELRALRESFAWRLAGLGRIFRAESRPSTILYARFKSSSDRHPGSPHVPAADDAPVRLEPDANWSARQPLLEGEIRKLQQAGTKVAIFRVPQGKPIATAHPADFVDAFCRDLGFPQLDVEADFARTGTVPAYTDGLHMDSASARKAAQFLAAQAAAEPALQSAAP